MKQFEYKTLEIGPDEKWIKSINLDSSDLGTQLNILGKEGWELINSIDHSREGYTQKVILFFKRELI